MTNEDAGIILRSLTKEIILFADNDGRVTDANDAALTALGCSLSEIKNISLHNIMPSVFPNAVQMDKLIMDSYANTPFYRKNMTCFFADMKCTKINDYYVIMSTDISEKNEICKELQLEKKEAADAMKARNEFVANITHELRTPVSGVLGHTRNALSGDCPHEYASTFKIIERCCNDMNKIINNILDFSKAEAGKFVLEEREFDFNEFMNHIYQNHETQIEEKGVKFEVDVDESVPARIIGDEYHIAQIVNNLISNAAKFTAVGKISVKVIKTRQKGSKIELFFVVMDTGIGIEPKDKAKLFNSFSQVDASISRRYGGTGLGLSVCKSIVELMQGTINVESEPGKGSMFSFSIMVHVPGGEKTIEQKDIKSITEIQNKFRDRKPDKKQAIFEYGSKENIETVVENIEKISICVDMESWEKAEMFSDKLKKLLNNAPEEMKQMVLKLEMSVRKENRDNAVELMEKIKEKING